jgi:hypothetical protein
MIWSPLPSLGNVVDFVHVIGPPFSGMVVMQYHDLVHTKFGTTSHRWLEVPVSQGEKFGCCSTITLALQTAAFVYAGQLVAVPQLVAAFGVLELQGGRAALV